MLFDVINATWDIPDQRPTACILRQVGNERVCVASGGSRSQNIIWALTTMDDETKGKLR